jgi:hypothetical protein
MDLQFRRLVASDDGVRYDVRMTDMDDTNESPGNQLCKACGLCCTGHLFIWTKLRSAELDAMEALDVEVFRSPGQRGFNQPCPLWQGQCTVYASPSYPRFCHTYKCKLLKEVLDENTSLSDALHVIQQARELIHEVEALLPPSSTANFRERLIEQLTAAREDNPTLRRKANELLMVYEMVFGVKDLME